MAGFSFLTAGGHGASAVFVMKQVQWHFNPWPVAADFLHHAFQGVAIAIQVDVTEVPDQTKYADPDDVRFPAAMATALRCVRRLYASI